MLWLVWSFIQTAKTFSTLFCILIIYVFTGVAFLIFFKNFFLCSHNLANCSELKTQLSAYLFDPSSSLNLTISGFWFKVRRVYKSSFIWTLGHCRVIDWSNFNIFVLQRLRKAPPRGREIGFYSWSVEQPTSIYQVHHLIWLQFMAPQNNYISNIKD